MARIDSSQGLTANRAVLERAAAGELRLLYVAPERFGSGPFLERIRHHVHELAFPVPAAKTKLCYAQLGGDAGFLGAAACGRQLYQRGQPAPR